MFFARLTRNVALVNLVERCDFIYDGTSVKFDFKTAPDDEQKDNPVWFVMPTMKLIAVDE